VDKVEYNNRLDQINTLVEKHDIQGAVEIAETIDWRRVKSLRTLCMVADIYEADRMYEESKEILLLAYNRSSVGKAILYRLVEISVKLDQMDDAVEYYTEYSKNARGDSAKYLLKYKIYRARRAPLEEQAEILEQYKGKEYTERWAFELARIYDRMGEKDKCVEECDDLILWFSEGKYVAKAMELKMKYGELSPMQKKSYQEMKKDIIPNETLRMEAEAAGDDGLSDMDIIEEEEKAKERTERMTMVAKEALEKRSEEAVVSRDTEDLQDKLASSFRDVLSGFNRVKEGIINPSTPEEEETEEEVENLDEYSVVKDLEPENLSTSAPAGEDSISKLLEGAIAGEEDKSEETQDVKESLSEAISEEESSKEAEAEEVAKEEETAEEPAKEEAATEEVDKIIKETAGQMATEVEDIQTGNTRELKINSDVPIEEQILREDTAEEKRTRILESTRPEKLTEEQKKTFSYFSRVPGMDQQLLDALHGAYNHIGERTSKNGNIAIMGSRGTGKTKLFEGIVKAICQDLGLEATKVARITGTVMNEKDPAEIVSKMAGGFLLIEEAGTMSDETIEKFSEALGFRTDSMIVVIEDEKERMRKLLVDHSVFAAKFKTTISIPVFTNDELVTFARTYARENGYKVEEMGVLALYDLIGSKQSERDPITIDKVKDIMDEAIARTKKVTRRFGRKIAVRNTDEEGRILIYEKDFY